MIREQINTDQATPPINSEGGNTFENRLIAFSSAIPRVYEFRCDLDEEIIFRIENCTNEHEAAEKLRMLLNTLTLSSGLQCEVYTQPHRCSGWASLEVAIVMGCKLRCG